MKWSDYSIQKVDFKHKNYPAILKEIKNCPKTLFFRGNLDQKIFKKSLAIVGTRRMTQYGKIATERLVSGLVAEKISIISGFMYGVDSEAHRRCLEYGGMTVAVLGSGLNIIYPPENEKLYQQILEKNGLIISEYEPEIKPQLWTFPQRNRIVAGLASLGVLVIEAGEKSGSLITARLAKQQGKKVFAVPGPITSSVSAGTNLLLKTHQAKIVTEANDILGRKIAKPTLFSSLELSPIEKKIYQALEAEPLTPDELTKLTDQNIIEINKTLSLISLKGLIYEVAGKYYLQT